MQIDAIREFIEKLLADDKTGHALDHIDRVEQTALDILQNEPTADKELTIAIVLLHEVFDSKLNLNIDESELVGYLNQWGLTEEQIETLLYSIKYLSYSKNVDHQHILPLEGQIAQDADRIDAIGALGVARAFYYGGAIGQPLYDSPSNQEESIAEKPATSTCIGHFDDKLLNIYELINTDTGKEIGYERHQFLLAFKEQFYKEVF